LSNFCKLYQTPECGQILVKLDSHEDGGPEVRVYVQPENLGVCSMAVTYADTDEGWDLAEKKFSECDEAQAVARAMAILKAFQ
jgi:hypothetical protein